MDTLLSSDRFELYDLRVEVICPPGKPIYCGAKSGDHFILRGEMLHLLPGQGFSLYSLGLLISLNSSMHDTRETNAPSSRLAASASSKTKTNAPQ